MLSIQNNANTNYWIKLILAALALLALLVSWKAVNSRDHKIAQLVSSNESTLQQHASQISDLNASAQKDKQQIQELESLAAQLPPLKTQLSHARANNQRATHIATARTNLQVAVAELTENNSTAANELAKLPELKKQLSLARANNQRSEFVHDARDNLMTQVAALSQSKSDLQVQLNATPGLKKELSFAKAANQRSVQTSKARDNLMDTVQELTQSNTQLQAQIDTLPALKKKLSIANAGNQRSVHTRKARDNLMNQVQELSQTNAGLESQLDTLPALKKELSIANAGNQRSVHTRKARENLITQVHELNQTNGELQAQLDTVPALKKKLSFANAAVQRSAYTSKARQNLAGQVEALSQTNDELQAQLNEVPAMKKELSFATAAKQRSAQAAKARQNLMLQVQELSSANKQLSKEISDTNTAAVDQLKLDLSWARADAQRSQSRLRAMSGLINSAENLTQRNTDLQADLMEFTAMKKELSGARAELQRSAHLKQARDTLITQVVTSKADSAALQNKYTGTTQLMNNEIAELRNLMTDRDKKISALSSEIETLTNKADDLQAENDKSAKLQSEADKSTMLRADRANLHAELGRLRNDSMALQSNIEQLTTDNEVLHAENEKLTALETELETELTKLPLLQLERSDLHSQLGRLRARNQELNQSNKKLQKQQDDASNGLADATDTIGQLRESNTTLIAQTEKLQTALNRSESENSEMTRLAYDLSSNVAELKTQNQSVLSLKAKEKDWDNKLKISAEMQQTLRDELAVSVAGSAQKSSDNEALSEKIRELETERNSQQAVLANTEETTRLETAKSLELNSRVTELANENQALNEQLAVLGDEKNTLNTRVSALEGELSTAQNKNTEQSQQLSDLTGVNRDNVTEIEKLKSDAAMLADENSAQLASAKAEQEASITSIKKENAQTLAYVQELEQLLSDVYKVNDDKQTQIGQLEEQLAAVQIQNDATDESSDELLSSLRSALDKYGVDGGADTTVREDGSVGIRLSSESLFASGQATLSESGRALMDKVALALEDYDKHLISVHGHTDSVPVSGKLKNIFPSNWELSVGRAANTVNYLHTKKTFDPKQLSAVGFGEFNPIATNETPQGRASNRRIELIVHPAR